MRRESGFLEMSGAYPRQILPSAICRQGRWPPSAQQLRGVPNRDDVMQNSKGSGQLPQLRAGANKCLVPQLAIPIPVVTRLRE